MLTSGSSRGLANLTPLHRFPLVKTSDLEEFRETLTTKFNARGLELDAGPRPFETRLNFIKLANTDLVFSTCTAPHSVHLAASDLVRQHFPLRKSGHTCFGGTQFDISATENAVIPPGIEAIHEYEADFEVFIFRVKPSALQAKLSAVVGMPIARKIEFAMRSRFSNPSLQRLKRLLEFMVTELDYEDGEVSPAALAEFEQLLIIAFLFGNQHNFSDLMMREQPRPAPWQVRAVEEYIEANWNRPITVEDLATAAGASTRSVFKAFREARDCSPMAFVKGVRLSRARRMLEHPEPTTSVADVAFACGFLNPGHFATDYRRAFGELPSVTLASSRHRRN